MFKRNSGKIDIEIDGGRLFLIAVAIAAGFVFSFISIWEGKLNVAKEETKQMQLEVKKLELEKEIK
tara:strand:+ start:37034 stop:37231 length:198 start_codon:yes stop_codon:yes gene_type:complete